MNVLFVHQNFPAQFRHIAAALAEEPGLRVAAIGGETAATLPGVALYSYAMGAHDVRTTHSFARRFDLEARRAEQVLYTASEILASGFVPDVVVAHSGWGETLPLRAAFPDARLVVYCEYYYRPRGGDVGFDPADGPLSRGGEIALRARNAAALLALAESDVAVSPTDWQRSTFPPEFRPKIAVCHEGVDCDAVRPDPTASVSPRPGLTLGRADEIVTFVARDLEPIRGYTHFMRTLPRILRDRPRAHVLLVGGHGLSYGSPSPDGRSWKDVGLEAVAAEIDPGRVHFLGRLAYRDYLGVLQASSVHVYLTQPFVLSWSLVEAMAAGCAIVASDTGPCRDVIDGTNGVLADMLDPSAVASAVTILLADPGRRAALGAAARRSAMLGFERRACTARMRDLILGRG